MSNPDTTGWHLLNERTRENLVRAWHRNRETFRILRDQAFAVAVAQQRSRERADRERRERHAAYEAELAARRRP